MKQKRQAKILELIESYDIGTQEDMLRYLRDSGFDVTQATVSRDIRELKLYKGTGKDGRVRYHLTARKDAPAPRFSSALTESIVKVDYAGNIIVINTYPGMANAVATCVDSISTSDIVGSVAGDDTILVVVRSEERAKELCSGLRTMIKTI
jgi:transcriptional regulator of arginine metabolism